MSFYFFKRFERDLELILKSFLLTLRWGTLRLRQQNRRVFTFKLRLKINVWVQLWRFVKSACVLYDLFLVFKSTCSWLFQVLLRNYAFTVLFSATCLCPHWLKWFHSDLVDYIALIVALGYAVVDSLGLCCLRRVIFGFKTGRDLALVSRWLRPRWDLLIVT